MTGAHQVSPCMCSCSLTIRGLTYSCCVTTHAFMQPPIHAPMYACTRAAAAALPTPPLSLWWWPANGGDFEGRGCDRGHVPDAWAFDVGGPAAGGATRAQSWRSRVTNRTSHAIAAKACSGTSPMRAATVLAWARGPFRCENEAKRGRRGMGGRCSLHLISRRGTPSTRDRFT